MSHKLYKNIKTSVHQVILLFIWWLIRFYLWFQNPILKKTNKIYIIPSDPYNLVGAKGDEAMLLAAIEQIKLRFPNCQLVVNCTGPNCQTISKPLQLQIRIAWKHPLMPLVFLKEILADAPRVALVMGADVMDGYYSPIHSLKMIISADLMARCGVKTIFLGFSFNNQPTSLLKLAFQRLHPKVKVNLRDSISMTNYQNFTKRVGNLVADTAFLLTPQPVSVAFKAVSDWINQQKSLDRQIIVINYHSMLFKDRTWMAQLESSVKSSLEEMSSHYKLSWLLLPHDNRISAGDIIAMKNLYTTLTGEQNDNIFLVSVPPAAVEIKEIMGEIDGVIAGRMHLAIAALGRSKPVMVFSYQGKFSGLLAHFALPNWLELDPIESCQQNFLISRFNQFILELPQLQQQVAAQLPPVKTLALTTFAEINNA